MRPQIILEYVKEIMMKIQRIESYSLKQKRCHIEPVVVLAKVLNLSKFHLFIKEPSRVQFNLKNPARSWMVPDILKYSILHHFFKC